MIVPEAWQNSHQNSSRRSRELEDVAVSREAPESKRDRWASSLPSEELPDSPQEFVYEHSRGFPSSCASCEAMKRPLRGRHGIIGRSALPGESIGTLYICEKVHQRQL